MIRLLMTLMLFVIIVQSAFGLPLRRENRDLKLVTQQLIEKQTISSPETASATYVASALAGNTSADAAVISTGITDPDVPRVITITPIGTTTDLETCTITVAGTNYNYGAITEDFAFAANATTTATGSKAFRSVSSITFPANCESGSFGTTFNVGMTDALGLKRCMDFAADGIQTDAGGVYESTRSTFTADVDEVEKNTVDLNTAMDGETDVRVFFMQNFRCFP